MLHENWKDLPDYTGTDDYDYLIGKTAQEWAWEFLRRDPTYRRVWDRFARWQTRVGTGWPSTPCATVYRPRRRADEPEKDWAVRIGYETGIMPTKHPLEEYLGNKWSLKRISDPRQPFSQRTEFVTPRRAFPQQVTLADEFSQYIDDDETSDGAGFQRVTDGYAVLAFDLTRRNLSAQLTAAGDILHVLQKNRDDMGFIEVIGPPAPKPDKWLRHLRAIDARRTEPPMGFEDLARVLGGEPTNAKPMKEQGRRFFEQAEKAMKGFRKMLHHEDRPSTDKKP